MGDFNAKIGSGKVADVVGEHGLGDRNIKIIKINAIKEPNTIYGDDTIVIADSDI